MKRQLARLSIITALAASASFAETYYTTVPFDFKLQNKTAPAGDYVVDTQGSIVVIRSADHKIAFAMAGNSVTSRQATGAGKLVFHRYGNRAFLEQFWTRDAVGCEIPKSAEERELTAHGTVQGTRTTVALR